MPEVKEPNRWSYLVSAAIDLGGAFLTKFTWEVITTPGPVSRKVHCENLVQLVREAYRAKMGLDEHDLIGVELIALTLIHRWYEKPEEGERPS